MDVIRSGDHVKIVCVFYDEHFNLVGKKAIAIEPYESSFSHCWRVRLINGNEWNYEGETITAVVKPWIETGDKIGVAIYDTSEPYDPTLVLACCAEVSEVITISETEVSYSFVCSDGTTRIAKEHEVWRIFRKPVKVAPQEQKYTIEVGEAHLKAIARACELSTRIHLGQLDRIADEHNDKLTMDEVIELGDALKELNPTITKMDHPNASFGITNPKVSKQGKLSYEVWRSIASFKIGPNTQTTRSIPLELSGEAVPRVFQVENLDED